jgi:hypothetical protein
MGQWPDALEMAQQSAFEFAEKRLQSGGKSITPFSFRRVLKWAVDGPVQ